MKVTDQKLYKAYFLWVNAACQSFARPKDRHLKHFEKLAKLKFKLLEKHYIKEHGKDYPNLDVNNKK